MQRRPINSQTCDGGPEDISKICERRNTPARGVLDRLEPLTMVAEGSPEVALNRGDGGGQRRFIGRRLEHLIPLSARTTTTTTVHPLDRRRRNRLKKKDAQGLQVSGYVVIECAICRGTDNG
jgi:hypothetical protein